MAGKKGFLASKTLSLTTYYVGDAIDLKKCQEHIKKYHYLNRDHPLVVQLLDHQYAVLTKFGTVGFWNVNKDLAKDFLKELTPFVRGVRDPHRFTDTLTLHIDASKEEATFDDLYIKNLDTEKIKIISYVSAQSVALDRYEDEIDDRLDELGRVVESLKMHGKTKFNESELLRQVGNVLSVKQSTVSSLSLFDKPNATWEREEIEKLYERLRTAYELIDRFDVLNEKIDFLSENNTTLMNFIATKKSNFLEIVVIVLIVIEIGLFVVDIFKTIPR